jgi:acetyl-CoA acyltransferase 2
MTISGVASRWGVALGKGLQAEDSLWAALTDTYANIAMGMTAEKLAEKYSITRDQCDEYGLRSQVLFQKAQAENVFNSEIASIEVKGKKGVETFSIDEHPRANATINELKKLKPVFKENGVVTAGTASGISDGSASLVLVNEHAVEKYKCTPLTRLVAWNRLKKKLYIVYINRKVYFVGCV